MGLDKVCHGGVDAMHKASEDILNNRRRSASAKPVINNQAEKIVNSASNNTSSAIASRNAATPMIAHTSSLGTPFTPHKIDTHVRTS